jgi:hypothetical protein
VVLHDEWSTFGTRVSYDDWGKDMVIKKDRRVLCLDPETEVPWKKVFVYIPEEGYLSFQIEFPNHRTENLEYRKNLDAFVDASRRALPRVDRLGFNSNPPTGPLSLEPQTPYRETPYCYGAVIGSGRFGTVYRVVDVRDGDIYAAKRFTIPAQNGQLEQQMWLERIRNEYRIMKENTHVSLIPTGDKS